jgi:hypothetical protein
MEELTGVAVQDLLGYLPYTTEMSVKEVDWSRLVQWEKTTLWIAFVSFAFAPTFWNIIARIEYRTHIFTKLFCGSRYIGCYVLAAVIFCLQLERDFA